MICTISKPLEGSGQRLITRKLEKTLTNRLPNLRRIKPPVRLEKHCPRLIGFTDNFRRIGYSIQDAPDLIFYQRAFFFDHHQLARPACECLEAVGLKGPRHPDFVEFQSQAF